MVHETVITSVIRRRSQAIPIATGARYDSYDFAISRRTTDIWTDLPVRQIDVGFRCAAFLRNPVDLSPTTRRHWCAVGLAARVVDSLKRELIMSRRTIISLAASVIIGIGFVGTVSTDASAYRAGVARGGVYRGGVYRGGAYYRGVRPGVAIGIGAAAVGAAAVGAAAAGAYYGPGYYGAAPVGCPYGYYYYAPYNRCVPTP